MSLPPLRRRCVLYLSGFDPKGAAYYHALYREEAAKQARVSGLEIEVGPRRRMPGGDSGWSLDATENGASVHTHYDFLHWDDLVRAHWPRSSGVLWREVWWTTLHNLQTGALGRMKRLSLPPFVALFAPFLLMLSVLLGLPLLALGVLALAHHLGATAWLAAAGALTTFICGLWLASVVERRFSMLWLMRSFAFTRLQARGAVPELEERLDQHACTLIERVCSGEHDEVLLVGHSSGCIMAVEVLGRALQSAPALACGHTQVGLLTLGHCIPMLGTLPEAHVFRSRLALLATAPGVGWLDVAAPPDGCCFALCDPMLLLDNLPLERRVDRPKLVSPRFVKMFHPLEYAKIRRDKFRVHFQYLMAADLPTDYDYFRLTAGSRYLSQVIAEIKP